jgi:hypothetical protein
VATGVAEGSTVNDRLVALVFWMLAMLVGLELVVLAVEASR